MNYGKKHLDSYVHGMKQKKTRSILMQEKRHEAKKIERSNSLVTKAIN
jgi:hypothetical protein